MPATRAAGPDHRTGERRSRARAAALLLGASCFAYLLAVVVHEAGHYLANTVLGVPERGIVLHPFDLSYNVEEGDLSVAFGSQVRLALSGAAGPALNLLVGTTAGLVLWRRRSPRWLPLLMLGPVALVQEGVGMIIGLVDYPDVSSDWVDVMLAGVPRFVVGLMAAALLVSGFVWLQLLLPLVGVRADDEARRVLPILMAGIPLLMLGAVAYLALAGSNANAPEGMVMQNRIIALSASMAFVASVTALYKPLFPLLDRISHTDAVECSWPDAALALCLGAAVFVVQLAFFN